MAIVARTLIEHQLLFCAYTRSVRGRLWGIPA